MVESKHNANGRQRMLVESDSAELDYGNERESGPVYGQADSDAGPLIGYPYLCKRRNRR